MFDSLQPHGLLPTRLHIQEIFQARILEWVAISFSRASSQPRNQTCLSCICRWIILLLSHQRSLFSSVTQSCLTLCNPMDCSTPVFPVHHQLLEPAQTHAHWVNDAIQPHHPLSSPCPPALKLSQHQSFQMSQLFILGGQSIGVLASASVLPLNTQDWSPLGWTSWIFLQSKGLTRVF